VESETSSLVLRHFGWATGRASSLQEAGCWFGGGDDLTGDLHVLYSFSR